LFSSIGSKCAYGEKIYISLFVLQKCGAGDGSQQQFTFCLCCHLVLYHFGLKSAFGWLKKFNGFGRQKKAFGRLKI
jgi:hypothetical protein